MYDDCSTTPYPGSMSSLCFQLSEAQQKLTSRLSSSSPQHAMLRSIEEDSGGDRDGIMGLGEQNNRYRTDQQSTFDQNLIELQMQKLARGRYKCSRCGALKVRYQLSLTVQNEHAFRRKRK